MKLSNGSLRLTDREAEAWPTPRLLALAERCVAGHFTPLSGQWRVVAPGYELRFFTPKSDVEPTEA